VCKARQFIVQRSEAALQRRSGGLSHEQLQVSEQPGDRRAQLMSCVGHESALRMRRFAKHLEQ